MKIFILILFVCFSISIDAQRNQKSWEMGLTGGVTYYTGDLNPGGHFRFVHPAGGGFLRRNFNKRWGFRFNGIYGNLSGADNASGSAFQQNRNLSFSSKYLEGSGVFEFNYLPFSFRDDEAYYTPYVFWGLGTFWFSPKSSGGDGPVVDLRAMDNEGTGKRYPKIQINMPFGAGLKLKMNHRVFTSFEWGLRKTFTDYIDDVSTVYAGNVPYQRGDSKNKDWISYAGATLSIRLGGKPTTCWKQ